MLDGIVCCIHEEGLHVDHSEELFTLRLRLATYGGVEGATLSSTPRAHCISQSW